MMDLWNHMDALMCQVFQSSLGDLRLKWLDKLPTRSIENFHQLIKSFIAWFMINMKAPKGVSSLFTLRKGKNEMITTITSSTEKPITRLRNAPRSWQW